MVAESSGPRHLLDLIRQVKPRAALFTTYTFSVGYFDAVFVPVLRSVGCQDIAVLVDADEAARGTLESRSRAAGRVYQVAPVIALGGGVFHPKLAYLAAESDDVLAVSSGNLTASGQTFQLESFDAVSASSAPSVFIEFSEWLDTLGQLVRASSPQASELLRATVPRARLAASRGAPAKQGGLPPPSLIHTLGQIPREALQTVFLAEAEGAKGLVVLSPFHSPDGGPLLRLASSVGATLLAVGLDASRARLVAPFEAGRFMPGLPGRFVVANASRAKHRLHAKVFELQAEGKVLVMTGSVNATAQSFESSKNVEVSLARWLPESPFAWEEVQPEGYEPTLVPTDFITSQSLYVDAWLEDDWTLSGRLISRHALSAPIELLITRGESVLFTCKATLNEANSFAVKDVPSFDTTEASLFMVRCGGMSASCWLNVREQLDTAMEVRERRAAVDRVLKGNYGLEDVTEVIRLLTGVAQGGKGKAGARAKAPAEEPSPAPAATFSFLRWQQSGRQRPGSTSLGRSPTELLRAVTKWMNSDLDSQGGSDPEGGSKKDLRHRVELRGGTDKEQSSKKKRVNPHDLLDRLCAAIPAVLDRRPGLEHAGVLAEVAAARAVYRALKQEQNMAPCLQWLDRFSRFSFSATARESLAKIAAAMASVVVHRLRAAGQVPEVAVLRDAVERLSGEQMDAERWRALCRAGLARDLFRRIGEPGREEVVSCATSIASVRTLDDTLLSLLQKGWTVQRNFIARESEASTFPELAAAMRERRRTRDELVCGLLRAEQVSMKGAACPFCYSQLSDDHLAKLKKAHVLVHSGGLSCSKVLILAEPSGPLHRGVMELPDA